MIVCDTVTRLGPEEKEFAEKNIGVLFAFMRRYHLPEDYFGALAIAYVRFVWKYLNEKEKHTYSFSTLVWQRLRSELSHIARREQAERLLRFTDEMQATIGREDSYFENEGLDEAKSLLTQKQIQVLLLRIEGYTNAQIARMTGVTKRAIEKRFSRIRKVCKEIGN